jgi:hypothetical protein
MVLENIILSKVRLRRSKIICSPTYLYYRPKTNSVILLDLGHTQEENTYTRNREREGTLKLECG